MLLAALAVPLLATAMADQPGVSLTVYSSADPAGFDPQQFIAAQRLGDNPSFAWQVPGFGVVKELRNVSLKAGLSELRFTDVAAFIDPTTVSFTDLSGPGTSVLEQNFEFDLVSPSKLLERYLDQDVSVDLQRGDKTETLRGKLLSANQGQLVLDTGAGVRLLPQAGSVVTLGDSKGLITRPTLVWKVNAARGGERLVRTTYQTAGITWRADYNLVLNGNDTAADLGAWVSLLNLSGAAYENAQLKLIAGDVQRIQPQSMPPGGRGGDIYLGMPMKTAEAFEEKSFFEYHLYTLPRRTDVKANATQQITLFPTARNVPVQKVLVYDPTASFAGWGWGNDPYTDQGFGLSGEKKVDVFVRFLNDEESNLGMPLPKGKVRVYKQDDADGTLEFVGEDLIDHTPRNEKVSVRVGQAFDVVGERTQTDFSIDSGRRTMTESFRIEIRNRKKEPATVVVRERLYRWMNWEIVKRSDEFKKVDARTIEWEMTLQPDEVRAVTYEVRYTW